MACRQSEQTRRICARVRQQHAASGQRPNLQQDWECPICLRWFSQRRNGPKNHLRSHKLTSYTTHPPHQSPHLSSTASQSDIDAGISGYQEPLSTSESSSDSDTSTSFIASNSQSAQRVIGSVCSSTHKWIRLITIAVKF